MNRRSLLVLSASALALAACGRSPAPQEAETVRLVRVAVVEPAAAIEDLTLTGRIEAEDLASLGFRVAGRVKVRPANVGDQVAAGQVLAELEPQDQENALRQARAAVTTAEGRFVQAENHYRRRGVLLAENVIPQADFESAQQGMNAARAALNAARANLATAEEQLGFTVLRADASGIVTAIGAEPGEFVQAGQMVVRIARRDGRDAVFDVPAAALEALSADGRFTVSLAADPSQTVQGRVREVSPQADPVTRLFRVRVGLEAPPAAFRLGANVTGTLTRDASALLTIPVTAVIEGLQPTVWVVDPTQFTVAARPVTIDRRDPVRAFLTDGVKPGEIVVTAGTQSLAAGQRVRLPGGES
ncbi:MAG: efflux RND transporter periplasmic adaptor subunit [Hyphomicrobiales bacterium]